MVLQNNKVLNLSKHIPALNPQFLQRRALKLLLLGRDRKILILSPAISKFKSPASVNCHFVWTILCGYKTFSSFYRNNETLTMIVANGLLMTYGSYDMDNRYQHVIQQLDSNLLLKFGRIYRL